jgi:hypothetical protein
VDSSADLLARAKASLEALGLAQFEEVCANLAELGPWFKEARVVVGRAVLHHVPLAELLLGKLRTRLEPGTRVGFIEPDFRSPLGRLGWLEATGHSEVAALTAWANAINQLYLARRISPDVGASLARTLELAGYRNVHSEWAPCPASATTLENMSMFYDEVRDRLVELSIMTPAEVDRQKALLASLRPASLPPAWGTYRVWCEA